MTEKLSYRKATDLTVENLETIAVKLHSRQLSHMTLPEVKEVVELVSKIVPAGNVPGMVLSGLARLPGNRVPMQKMQQDIGALFSGVEQILDRAMYATFFMGPAYVLGGYQYLLKLAGKDISISFPEGIWQFYVEYALREDTARHANETHGFDTALRQNGIRLSEADRITAWAMAAITCLHQFDDLLANEWRERIAIALLQEAAQTHAGAIRHNGIYRAWERQRPYRREKDAVQYDYPSYRRIKFDQFLQDVADAVLTPAERSTWEAKLRAQLQKDLPAYQRQMSILAYLEPGLYKETRVPFEITRAQVGIVHRGNYYLLPVCGRGGESPADVLTIRSQIERLMSVPFAAPAQLSALTRVNRSVQASLRPKLNPIFVKDLERLRFAPIIINSDHRSRSAPLSELRQTERGLGDNALTIFDTGETFVFDQSHIFFDGAWGAALAEIMTNEALSWAGYLSSLPPSPPANTQVYRVLSFPLHKEEHELIALSPHVASEAGADTQQVDLKACLKVRRLLKQRNDILELTVNDLLVLYRAIHAATYQPSSTLMAEIKKLSRHNKDAASAVRGAIEQARQVNPAILIPVDASQHSPRDRLYPMSIEVPLTELDILELHEQTIKALKAYENAKIGRNSAYAKFSQLQRRYLASLAGVGLILSKMKEYAMQGESVSAGAIKLLAHLPQSVQRLLEKIPERFEVINNMIKGREVFSNVGAVVPTSTLTRFITAKDDNGQKQLVWGVITDAEGIMHINLRDFRPHVSLLETLGRKNLANLIAQDYLDAYAHGLNQYIQDLTRITHASQESHQPAKRLRG